ncbi:periplasmic nitrate reductase, NapE protein [Caenispirillum bisanense]|uniref:periplasmic nitrate reductase, NapE protein n=1 Tax=Caenispirillum bisanense TaxID=414052 RepID=UPI0031E2AEB1
MATRNVHDSAAAPTRPAATKKQEILMFLVLAVLIWPVITMAFIGAYGFIVWITQMIFGPPGPPSV